jgi:SH3-like domain-containing protein
MEDVMRKIGFALASFMALGVVAPEAPAPLDLIASQTARAAAGDPLVVTGNVVNVRFGPSTNTRIRQQVPRDQQVMELQREGDWVRVEIADSGGREGWIHGSLLAPPGGEPLVAAAPPEEAEPAPSEAAAMTEPAPAPPETAAEEQPGVGGPPSSTDVAATEPGEVAVIDPAITGDRAARPAVGQPAPSEPAPATIEPAAAPLRADSAELARFRQSVDYLTSRAVSVAGVDLFTDVEPGAGGVVQVAATDAWSSIPPAGQQSYANTLLDRWAAARGYGGPVSVQIVDEEGKVLLESSREQ